MKLPKEMITSQDIISQKLDQVNMISKKLDQAYDKNALNLLVKELL